MNYATSLGKDLLDCIVSLAPGKLPPMLFPPTVLENITSNAIDMVCHTHPEYELASRPRIRLL